MSNAVKVQQTRRSNLNPAILILGPILAPKLRIQPRRRSRDFGPVSPWGLARPHDAGVQNVASSRMQRNTGSLQGIEIRIQKKKYELSFSNAATRAPVACRYSLPAAQHCLIGRNIMYLAGGKVQYHQDPLLVAPLLHHDVQTLPRIPHGKHTHDCVTRPPSYSDIHKTRHSDYTFKVPHAVLLCVQP